MSSNAESLFKVRKDKDRDKKKEIMIGQEAKRILVLASAIIASRG